MHSKNNKKRNVDFFYLGGISSNTLCASAAGSTSELAGASVAAAPVTRPASFFLLAFEVPELSAALFLFADVFPSSAAPHWRFGPRAQLHMPRARLLRARWSLSTDCARAKMAKSAARRLFNAAVWRCSYASLFKT